MAYQQRRPAQDYSAVPQGVGQGMSRPPSTSARGGPSRLSSTHGQVQHGRGAIAQGVATGQIGANYGPYSYHPGQPPRDFNGSRFSAAASEVSQSSTGEKSQVALANTSSTVPAYLWDTKDPDLDDVLHNPDPVRDAALDKSFTLFSGRGWMNASALAILLLGLITLFAGYPVIIWVRESNPVHTGYNLGGINGTGQIPSLPNLPSLIDKDTPSSAYSRIGTDGKKYDLVFSDEFEQDGRTFWPGDDPYWEAVNLHYWPTGDLEWYDPQAIVTSNGSLVITLSEILNHDLNFQSGMLTSWNKVCFTTGYIEVSISMPGSPKAPGLWPGAWTMGNLGRAGYGGTTEGMWPYTYAACDIGTFPNQTNKDGTPANIATGAPDGGPLSYLPGQRLSACTCPGSDHPGPNVQTGRGVPEIDILETQVDTSRMVGQVSQSFQMAPYNLDYNYSQTPTIYSTDTTTLNSYKGGVYQQAVSAVTDISASVYNDEGYAPYAFEIWSDPNNRDDGYITWFSNGVKTWTLAAADIGPDAGSGVSARLIPEEPMYMLLNLGLSPGFQKQDYAHLEFPSKMYVDYIRVYQREGLKNGLTCDPPLRPTANYINNHEAAYTNPNWTTWAQAGYSFPRNSVYDGC